MKMPEEWMCCTTTNISAGMAHWFSPNTGFWCGLRGRVALRGGKPVRQTHPGTRADIPVGDNISSDQQKFSKFTPPWIVEKHLLMRHLPSYITNQGSNWGCSGHKAEPSQMKVRKLRLLNQACKTCIWVLDWARRWSKTHILQRLMVAIG